jgi:hypothetical protein
MYSIQMTRPGYSGKTKYIVKVNTLSDVAAFIILKYLKVDAVLNLTRRERLMLWRKCYAIIAKKEFKHKDVIKWKLYYIFKRSKWV